MNKNNNKLNSAAAITPPHRKKAECDGFLHQSTCSLCFIAARADSKPIIAWIIPIKNVVHINEYYRHFYFFIPCIYEFHTVTSPEYFQIQLSGATFLYHICDKFLCIACNRISERDHPTPSLNTYIVYNTIFLHGIQTIYSLNWIVCRWI